MSKCAFLRAKLAQTVADLRQAGAGEKLATGAKAAWLASAKTFGRNLAGNSFMAGMEHTVTQGAAATMDFAIALARHVGGGRQIPLSQLREVPFPSIQGIRWGLERGFKEGVARGIELVRTGVDVDAIGNKYDLTRVTFDTPALNKAVHTVFDLMEGSDKPWFGLSYQMSLYNDAQIAAIREGLRGAERTARVNQLLAAPTDQMHLRALETAQYATFKNQTALARLAAGAKQSVARLGETQPSETVSPRRAALMRQAGRAAETASELVMPFTNVPAAVAGVAIDYSPLGFIKTLAEQLPPEARSQRAMALGLARAGAGTSIAFGLGYTLAQSGRMTGSLPNTPGERAVWDAEGRQANSIRIGDRWYSLQAFIPVSLPALLGANLWQAHQEQPDASVFERAVQMAGFEAKTLSEQTFLQGVNALTDAMADPQRNAGRFLTGMVPVPSLLGQLAAGVDPTPRAPQSSLQRLAAKVPGVSYALPERRDIMGEVHRRAESPLAALPLALLDITNSRPARDDLVTRELQRLRVFPGLPSKIVKVGGQRVARTGDEYADFLAISGPPLKAALLSIIGNPNYQRLSDDAKTVVLRRAIDHIRATATAADKARRLRGTGGTTR